MLQHFDKVTFKNLLEKAMGYRKKTEYADEAGVNRTYISKYMNLRLNDPPSPEIIKRLANKAHNNVTYDDLMRAAGYLDIENNRTLPSHNPSTIPTSGNQRIESDLISDTAKTTPPDLDNSSKLSKDVKAFLDKIKEICKDERGISIDPISSLSLILPLLLKMLSITAGFGGLPYLLENKDVELTNNGIPISENEINKIKGLFGNNHNHVCQVPILGTIRAGIPILAEENYEGELDIPADLEADFALRVMGDSMNGVGIYEGDYAICRQAQNASSGDIVVALRDDAGESVATLKFFFNDNGKGPVLRAANPNYEDLYLKDGCRIGGIMIAQLRKEPPSYRVYRDFISTKYSGYENWVEAIETAAQCGISAQQVKESIKLQWDMLQRMTGKK